MRGLVIAAMLLAAPGCFMGQSPAARRDALQSRAEFDLGCPREQTRWIEFDAHSYGATGCGHRATYVEACHDGSCSWLLNGTVELRADAPGATAAAP
jgi:hypothetical protein